MWFFSYFYRNRGMRIYWEIFQSHPIVAYPALFIRLRYESGELSEFIEKEGAVYFAFEELVSVAEETAKAPEKIQVKILSIITPCLDAMEKFKEKSLETKEG
jgi:hypothetical protein